MPENGQLTAQEIAERFSGLIGGPGGSVFEQVAAQPSGVAAVSYIVQNASAWGQGAAALTDPEFIRAQLAGSAEGQATFDAFETAVAAVTSGAGTETSGQYGGVLAGLLGGLTVNPTVLTGAGTVSTPDSYTFDPADADAFTGSLSTNTLLWWQNRLVRAGLLEEGGYNRGQVDTATRLAMRRVLGTVNEQGYLFSVAYDETSEGVPSPDSGDIFKANPALVARAAYQAVNYLSSQRQVLPAYVPQVRRKPSVMEMRDSVLQLFGQYGVEPSARELRDFAGYLSAQYDLAAEYEEQAGELDYIAQNEAQGWEPSASQERMLAAAGGTVPQIDPEGALRARFRQVFAGQIRAQDDADAQAARRNMMLGSILQQAKGTAQYLGWPG